MTLISLNPSNEEVLWRGNESSHAELVSCVADAKRAAVEWDALGHEARFAVVDAFGDVLSAHSEEYADLISRETGKAKWETTLEVAAMLAKIDISKQAFVERSGARRFMVDGVAYETTPRPHGVLAVFAPFNFPAHLPHGHIIPAILAGNSVLLKPSELTPACGAFYVELWKKTTLPQGVIQCVQGGPELGRLITSNQNIDGVLFTGSSKVGIEINKSFAETPGRLLALEMGGNNPIIVSESEDVELIADTVFQSAYITTGQRCTCARRVIIDSKTVDVPSITEALKSRIRKVRISDPFSEPAPFMGPLVSEASVNNVLSLASQLDTLGAEVHAAVERVGKRGFFVTPGLYELAPGVRSPDLECFGPILVLQTAEGIDACIQRASETEYGLAASVLSDNRGTFEAVRTGLKVGVINWNRPTTGASSKQPFGGVGISGNLRPSAYYAADYSSYPQATIQSETLSPISPTIPGLSGD